MATVLLIEDDEVIARTVSMHLRHAGFDVEHVDEGERALRKLRFERPDLCLVDLMLPGCDGWTVIERARSEGIATPMIVVSARASELDKVKALSLGADDYLAKPFGMAELVARVCALQRRASLPSAVRDETISVSGLVIDTDLQQAFLVDADGTRRNARLTVTEFRLLYALACERGRVLTRDELRQRVWGVRHRYRDRTVDVCVRKLREKIDRAGGSHTYLHTHYGIGYRFAAELGSSEVDAHRQRA